MGLKNKKIQVNISKVKIIKYVNTGVLTVVRRRLKFCERDAVSFGQ